MTLPSSFNGDTIASITFSGIDNGDPYGDPFLAALTIQTVPEPGSFMVFGLGALAFGVRYWRK